ncbi:ABC transporter ATP-binding protein [Tenggerimyces flavus]|uniref:ABC transporter ATP-binding protein n=1 Tax=Tenggerimyces flavus TaxID=1708749 RepID=A0ABV7YB54_9ACTN|nr:ABC transporter ATP-binding protein [Tenggerimyces flavus]MBM7789793.1 oligopeptide/dipeptide ABC transporter ATP-binding protein [Tenggerimyces flavus]
MLLEVKDLRTHFDSEGNDVKAVDGVSFDVERGETLSLVGESGSGKSVSGLSIMRLVPSPPGRILGGQVLFDGVDLLKLDAKHMRRIRGKEIAMIFQEPMTSLNPVLSIGRQLTEVLRLHQNATRTEARKRAIELLGQVQISDPEQRLSQYPHHLSGGMRQRVMFAMALACRPKLILADEPTTALDVTIQAQILELMSELSAQAGVAMIIITHNLGVVARYAQRVNVMYAGKIVEQATTKELFANPRHPYTLGLMRSVPRLDMERTAKLEPIQGSPPDLGDLPPGCAYHPRCPFVMDRCKTETPPLVQVGTGHLSACWAADRLGERAKEPVREAS